MKYDNLPGILHLIHSLEGGGTERTLVSLLNRFDPTLWRHEVVTLRKAGSLARFLPDHVACRALNLPAGGRLAGLRLARIARMRETSVIHARNTGCWFDAILASALAPRAALVLGFHGLESGEPFSRRQRLLARLGLTVGARFASVSEAGRGQLVHEARVPKERIDVLLNGVDLARFVPAEPPSRRNVRKELGIDRTSFVVGTVGRLAAVKRHDLLIEAMRAAVHAVPDLVVLLIGAGPECASLTRLAQKADMQDRVVFTGSRDDIPRMLAAMDLYVCCSESEGMNNALLEALACGVPAVVTDVGNNKWIVGDGEAGIVIPRSAATALTQAVISLASSTTWRRRMSQAARLRATSFDIPHTVSAYEKWYRDLLRPRCGRRGDQPKTDPVCNVAGPIQVPPGRTISCDPSGKSRSAAAIVR
ncbi:MAG: glycosyltransferase [Planctomycetes bacterium]|nr:glycosyltransferase [Planctomycetota bacterium]